MTEVKNTTEPVVNGIDTHTADMTEANPNQAAKVNGINPMIMTEDKKDNEQATNGSNAHITTENEKDSESVAKDPTIHHTPNPNPSFSTIPSNGTNAWTAPGPAAFDFRSDTVTSPTASMLAATANTSLLDDVFREDPTTNDLEQYVAGLVGKEAGIFVISGTMGNQLSMRTHLGGPPHSVLADSRSHIIGWEAGGIASLSGAMPIPISPSNTHHLTLSDITTHTTTSPDPHYSPTRLICLENTLAGTILPLSDCQAISKWAWSQNPPIAMHLDGARLWEAVAAGAGSLREYADCFDSVTMCFSKGLGAPIGSIICANTSFVNKARHLRKMMGGGLRMAGVVTAAARVAVDETFMGGKLAATHERAREVARMWEGKGGKLAQPVETNMVWLDIGKLGVSAEEIVRVGVGEGVRLLGGRVVVHYQIEDEAVGRLGRVMDAVLGIATGGGENGVGGKGERKDNVQISNDIKEKAEEIMAPEME